MKANLRNALSVAVLLLVLTTGAGAAQAPPPVGGSSEAPDPAAITGGSATYTFTYQGAIEEGGVLANGDYDFIITLWDGTAPTASQLDTLNAVGGLAARTVEDGFFSFYLFPSTLAFSEAFSGGERWLEVSVSPAGAGNYTTLPRQPITPTPYAWGLKPGAVMTDTIPLGETFYVGNGYDDGTIGGAIFAENHADTSPTIYGKHHGTGHALYGWTESSYPTIGGYNNGTGAGVRGDSDTGTAVYGYSDNGNGVVGYTGTADDFGVVGVQTGHSTSDREGYWESGGFFGGANGVIGLTKVDLGYAVLGWDKSAGGSWAGYFDSNNGNGVYASVPAGHVGLNTNGTKPAVVNTYDGARLLYTEESAEVWFTDYGFGELEDGTAKITIDPIFAQTVDLDQPYHVFVEPYGPASLYVADRTPEGFIVSALGGGNCEFSYRLVAKRLGYGDQRLERAPWADADPNVNPAAAEPQQQMPTEHEQ